MKARLDAQIAFLKEADHLKSVIRASRLIDGSRFENSAEHSWHVMLYALVLSDQAGAQVDILRVLQMLLIHDIVEIDAGDAPIHGNVDLDAQAAAEQAAARRLFGLLPDDLESNFGSLWSEFEEGTSPDARFAKAIDRLQTPITNIELGGGSWINYNVTMKQLDHRVGVPINRGMPIVWGWLRPKLLNWFKEHGVTK